MYRRVIITEATAALILKHQAISIHSADKKVIVMDQFYIKHHICSEKTSDYKITLWIILSWVRVKLGSVARLHKILLVMIH